MASGVPECSKESGNPGKETSGSECPLTYLFVELTSLDELSFPTSSSARIKYTCLDASAHYLAVGSTSGTVYLFSRFASKYRNRLSSVPIQVISIKDGPISKLSISPDEKYLAAASKRGSLTITSLVGIGQNPIILFSSDCHTNRDKNDQSIFITELCWCDDSSAVYAGDTKGRISRTRIHNRNFFRSPSEIVFETDSEIVQIDLRDNSLLASTLTRCCICDLKTRSCVQVGKRLRNGHFGAVFYADQQKRKLLSCEDNKPSANLSASTELTVIFASRPNGRLWEANGRGVVYSTHQYRNLTTVCHFPIISFKEEVPVHSINNVDIIGGINFGRLTVIRCQDKSFLLTKTNTSFCLIDPGNSHMVLMSTMSDIDSTSEYAINGADIFLLSSKTDSLRKLTLFTVQKAVEKLHWRQCYFQAAQIIYANYTMNRNFNMSALWNPQLLEDIMDKIQASHHKSRLTANVNGILQKILSELKKNGVAEEKPKVEIHRLNSGIHRVVQFMENSGYEDDFTFRAPSPLRLRSKSSPHMQIEHGWKRRSLPLNKAIIEKNEVSEVEGSEDAIDEHRKKLINEARNLLLNAEKSSSNHLVRNGSVESLRTLLDCSNIFLSFDQQVTIGDVTKDLESARNFLRLIGSNEINDEKQKQRKLFAAEKIDFTSVFGRRDPLEMLEKCMESIPPNINISVGRLRTVCRPKRGARIVKAIKPVGKKNLLTGAEWSNLKADAIVSGESMNRDPTSSESLNLNCNVADEGEQCLKQNSDELPNKHANRLLNESYVVEKNFVAIQPIKMTWTMNECDEQTDLLSMKSSTATITPNYDDVNNGSDERLMQSSEVIVKPATLTISEIKNPSECCRICGLHRLWRYVMIFGPKMSQLRVTVNEFTNGGVPVSTEQWTKLFDYYIVSVENKESFVGRLCNDCAAFFEIDERLKQRALSIRETLERIEKRNEIKKYSEDIVKAVTESWDEDLVYNAFFKHLSIRAKKNPGSKIKSGDIRSLVQKDESPCLDSFLKKFPWLPSVTTSQLLLSMLYCEGFDVMLNFLKNNETILEKLTVKDWQWLGVMKAYECMRHTDLMPSQTINDLLTELKISEVEDAGALSSTALANRGNGSCGPSTGSLIISVDGNCPCCTLPLKMRVTQNDGYITVFRCGHLYHQICLREANLWQCIRCEIERRRHRQKQQQHSVSSSANFSNIQPLSSAQTSHNTPIKFVRTNVTSPMKTSRKI